MAAVLAIRTATPDDLAPLDALFARSYPKLLKPDYPPSVLVTALPMISRAQPALLASGTYFVAELAGEIVGAGGWTPARGGTGNIRHVVTDARHVRQGIGRTLMLRVLQSARQAGIHLLHCHSTRTAVPFYRALGFVELGPMAVELAPGISFPAIRMLAEVTPG